MSFTSSISLCNEPVGISTHSDGAVSIKVPQYFDDAWQNTDHWVISANIKDPSGTLALIYLLDHLNTHIDYDGMDFVLDLTYMPNARQDRVTGNNDEQTPNIVKTLCKLLSSYTRVRTVYCSDVHSNVPSILLNNLQEQDHLQCFILSVPFETIDTIDYFISPDLGAYKKVKKIADNYEIPYLVAQKERNPVSREVELTLTTDLDLTGKTVMICDDIIDYGNSVQELIKILKEKYKASDVYVYATHGILPLNSRVNPPSRFSFILNNVKGLFVNSLWEDQANPEIPENVSYFQLF